MLNIGKGGVIIQDVNFERSILNKKAEILTINLTGGVGVTTDFPGPAAGFIRVFDFIQVTPDTIASPLSIINCDIFDGVTTYRTNNTVATTTFQTGLVQVLGSNEVARFTNNGANAGKITGCFWDIPDTNITLIRMQVANALQTIVPGPLLSTEYNTLFQYLNISGSNRSFGVRLTLFNQDSITHSLEFILNGVLRTRISANANTVSALPAPTGDIPVIMGENLEVQTTEAIVANNYVLTGAYITLPI